MIFITIERLFNHCERLRSFDGTNCLRSNIQQIYMPHAYFCIRTGSEPEHIQIRNLLLRTLFSEKHRLFRIGICSLTWAAAQTAAVLNFFVLYYMKRSCAVNMLFVTLWTFILYSWTFLFVLRETASGIIPNHQQISQPCAPKPEPPPHRPDPVKWGSLPENIV